MSLVRWACGLQQQPASCSMRLAALREFLISVGVCCLVCYVVFCLSYPFVVSQLTDVCKQTMHVNTKLSQLMVRHVVCSSAVSYRDQSQCLFTVTAW